MTADTLISLIGIAFAASWTPGPNNSMLASSGATYGLRATLPHMAGVTLGFPVMIFLVGFGLGEIFRQSPLIQEIARYTGAGLILWIAWKIANAQPPGQSNKTTRPFRFIEAVGFQWINPKGWVAAIAITTQFVTADHPISTSLIVALVFIVSGASSTFAWAGFGQTIGRFLHSHERLRAFNLVMAATLVLFLVLLLLEQ